MVDRTTGVGISDTAIQISGLATLLWTVCDKTTLEGDFTNAEELAQAYRGLAILAEMVADSLSDKVI